MREKNGEILEWLLVVHYGRSVPTSLLCWTEGSVDRLKSFLAHGANVNEDSILPRWAGFDRLVNGDVAAEARAFFVGSELWYFPISLGNTTVARQRLKYGAYARDPRTSLLHETVNRKSIEAVRLLIEKGFLDVDERFVNGHTPLTAACDQLPSDSYAIAGDERPRNLTKMLLGSGPDGSQQDPEGRSALEHALAREGHVLVVRDTE